MAKARSGPSGGAVPKAVIPHGERYPDESLDRLVDVRVLGRVQVVDITSEMHAAIGRKLEIRWEPLVGSRPVGIFLRISSLVPFCGTGNHFPLPGPLIYGVFHPDNFVWRKSGRP